MQMIIFDLIFLAFHHQQPEKFIPPNPIIFFSIGIFKFFMGGHYLIINFIPHNEVGDGVLIPRFGEYCQLSYLPADLSTYQRGA